TAILLFSPHLTLVNSRRPGHAVLSADSADGGLRPHNGADFAYAGTRKGFWSCPTTSSWAPSPSSPGCSSASGSPSWSAGASPSTARRPLEPPPTGSSL